MQYLLPLLKCVFTEVPPALLMGSALASGGSILELTGTYSCLAWAQLLASSHRGQPCTPPTAAETLPCKPNTTVLIDTLLFRDREGES